MNKSILILLSVVFYLNWIDVAAAAPLLPDYSSAIDEAQASGRDDRKWELRSCVRQWGGLGPVRSGVFNGFDAEEARKFSVVMEIGHSAFQRYDFVLAVGESMKSSFGKKKWMRLSRFSYESLYFYLVTLEFFNFNRLYVAFALKTDDRSPPVDRDA